MSLKSTWFWAVSLVILLVLSVTATILAVSRYSRASAIEISFQPEPSYHRLILVTGNVSLPGLYPCSTDDTIGEIIRAAGGSPEGNDIELNLRVTSSYAEAGFQKIDINRADVWLLKALPGIGEVLAQRIIDYRKLNGPFHNCAELARVAGISDDTLQKIQNLITVSEW